ncbi:hypothetical protein Phum_PHUM622980, partial [Pediculus humanus corporis]
MSKFILTVISKSYLKQTNDRSIETIGMFKKISVYIKDYFGVKYALYFAWLGFYTHMLIPASIVGLICFFYGWITLNYNTLSQDICKSDDLIMCPLCDETCDYWKLTET